MAGSIGVDFPDEHPNRERTLSLNLLHFSFLLHTNSVAIIILTSILNSSLSQPNSGLPRARYTVYTSSHILVRSISSPLLLLPLPRPNISSDLTTIDYCSAKFITAQQRPPSIHQLPYNVEDCPDLRSSVASQILVCLLRQLLRKPKPHNPHYFCLRDFFPT